jgi:hypothetical protein
VARNARKARLAATPRKNADTDRDWWSESENQAATLCVLSVSFPESRIAANKMTAKSAPDTADQRCQRSIETPLMDD